jgi:hypothetical protein
MKETFIISLIAIAIILVIFFWYLYCKETKPEAKYVKCIDPIPFYLTKNKEYKLEKKEKDHQIFYIIKRDDGSIDRNSKYRFTKPYYKAKK